MWFADRTAHSGIDFRHDSGTNENKPFPAANGSGVGALDFDLDGRYDLYFASGAPFPQIVPPVEPRNCLYRNLGEWRFSDCTAAAGIGLAAYSAGVAVGDFDADGFPDVYVSCFGANSLFHNRGDGTFEDIGVASGTADERWGTSAAFFDYDDDGLLDLYVCNYAKWTWESNRHCGDAARNVRLYCSPHTVEAEDDVLFRNRGDGGFDDRTVAAGLAGRPGRAQGVVAADLNGDGLIDLYLGNDLHPNSLFFNRGGGKFQDATELSGAAYDSRGKSQAGMGVEVADFNRNGRFDMFVTNFQGENNSLYENLGQELFQEVSYERGVAAESLPWVGWGTSLADFNLDGWADMVVVNGHVDDNRHLLGQEAPYEQPPLAYQGKGKRFEFLGENAGPYFAERHAARGLALADLDNDHAPDLVITHQDARPALLQNVTRQSGGRENRSIVLRLVSRSGNRDAVGALITLRTTQRTATEQIRGGGSYLCAHDLRVVLPVLVGETLQAVEVRWPGGTTSHLDADSLAPGKAYIVIGPSKVGEGPLVFGGRNSEAEN